MLGVVYLSEKMRLGKVKIFQQIVAANFWL